LSRLPVPPDLARNRGAGAAKVREEGACRMCRRLAQVRPLTRHHLVAQRWFRSRLVSLPVTREEEEAAWMEWRRLRDADANIVPLCEPCHKQVEGDAGHRLLLRRVLAPEEATFCILLRGQEWFDHRYPPRRARRPAAVADSVA
jgi:hypothetical protein